MKDELLKAVWPGSFVEESNLAGYISGLRKTLTDQASYIATVPGQGYQFTARVKVEEIADSLSLLPPKELEVQQDIEIQQMRETTHVAIRETSSPMLAVVSRKPLLSRWPFWVGVVVVIAGAAIGYNVYLRSEPRELSKVMVGDFLNLTGDLAFDHTLKNSLDLSLAHRLISNLMGAAEEHSTLGMMQKALLLEQGPGVGRGCEPSDRVLKLLLTVGTSGE